MMSFMVGASVPIWAGKRQKQIEVEAVAMREMAEAELDNAKAETSAELLEVMSSMQRVARLSDLYSMTILPQANAVVGSAFAAYQVGTVDFMTVLDARMTVNRYRLELVRLAAEKGSLVATLEMVSGQSWIDPDSAIPGDNRR
jgi:outer membrane protein TolC